MVGRRFVGLDGLKGIALIAIVLYHCDQGVLPGGFLGVDVFFTISGFLIVSSLLRRIDAGRGIGWGEYYLKRFRRIYPALLALIPITVAMAWFINRDMLVGIRNQILTVSLGCYNWYAISSGSSYFAQMNPDMFRHMWFMSVLMQFYLLVPIAVYVLLKSLHRWIPVFVLTGLAICSALSMGLRYHIDDDPTRVYFGSDTHAMGLWLGAAFAWALMLLRHGNGRVSETQLMDRIHARWGRIGPIAAFVALLALLWMMRHIGQGAMSFRFAIASASTLSRSIDSRLHSLRIMDAGLAGVQTACHDRPLFLRHLLMALAVMAARAGRVPAVGCAICRSYTGGDRHADRRIRGPFMDAV